jgi:phage terminase small subunit
MSRSLNIRQQRFCEFIAAGESQTDAYLKAGWNVPRTTARFHAARLITKDNIEARIAQLRSPEQVENRLTRDRKLKLLMQIVENPTASLDARLRAMAEDSKMQGHYEPEQHVIEAGPKSLDAVRARARAMASPMARSVPRD